MAAREMTTARHTPCEKIRYSPGPYFGSGTLVLSRQATVDELLTNEATKGFLFHARVQAGRLCGLARAAPIGLWSTGPPTVGRLGR